MGKKIHNYVIELFLSKHFLYFCLNKNIFIISINNEYEGSKNVVGLTGFPINSFS